MRSIRKMIYWSVGVSMTGGAIWPFFGGKYLYFISESTYKLMIAAVIINLTKGDFWSNRGAIMIFLLTLMEVLKVANWTLGMDYWWDANSYNIPEYLLAFTIMGLCLIDYRPLFIPILLYILNFNNPCRLKKN